MRFSGAMLMFTVRGLRCGLPGGLFGGCSLETALLLLLRTRFKVILSDFPFLGVGTT